MWQEQEAGHRSVGIVDPLTDGDVPLGERCVEGRTMFLDASPRGSVVGQDEQPSDPLDCPTASSPDLRCKARLPVDPMQHRLHIGDGRLDLHDEQRAGRSVEGKDVDRTAFSSELEGDLGRHFPAGRSEEGEAALDEVGVCGVKEAIEALAVPQQPDIDSCAQSRRDADDGVQRHTVDAAALDTPDHRSGDASLGGELLLRQSPASPERSQREPEPDDVHEGIMDDPALLARIRD